MTDITAIKRTTVKITLAIALIAGVTLSSGPAYAAGPGEAGFVFLKLGTDARAEALGGAHVAISDGVSALYYNPAGMVWSPPGQVLATYHNWVSDIQAGFIGGVFRLGTSGRIGAAIQYLDFGDFHAASVNGTVPGESGLFGASDVAISVSLAQKLGDRSSAGVTARLIFESLDDASAQGVAFDIGLMHQLRDRRTQVGAAVRNAGFQTSAHGEGAKDKLPVTGVIGVSHKFRGTPLMFTADVMKPYDDDFGAGVGVEVSALDPLMLRAGYNSLDGSVDTGSDSDDFAGLRFGVGFILEKLVIDYGYGTMSKLGSSHRFTIRTNVL